MVIDLYLAISHALGIFGNSIGQQLLPDNTEQNLLAGMGSALLATLRSYRDPRLGV